MELTDALGLETAPREVGQTRARDGALQQVALPAAEEHGAADLYGGTQTSVKWWSRRARLFIIILFC